MLSLRQHYVDQLAEWKTKIPGFLERGVSVEKLAITYSIRRRELGQEIRRHMRPEHRHILEQRNLQRYGDIHGPTVEWLLKQGKTWPDILDSATRPGGEDLAIHQYQ